MIEESIRDWLALKLGADDVVLTEFTRHTEGFSWEAYTCLARWQGGTEQRGLALRVEPRDGLSESYDAVEQFQLHQALLAHSDVPMPELYWLEGDPSVIGARFYAMERLDGTVPVQWQRDASAMFSTDAERLGLGRQFVRIQAQIHALDPRLAGFEIDRDPEAAARAEIDRWAGLYERSVLTEIPLLRFAIGWLRENCRCSRRLALCHGDYRIGNFMVRDKRIVGIFDWEYAHVSDPIEDIAYSGCPLFRGRGTRLSQLLEPDEYFSCYEESTGLHVDPDVFAFWTVLGLVKAAAVHVRGARAFEEGRTHDLRLAALGHQVHHPLRLLARELDLVGAS